MENHMKLTAVIEQDEFGFSAYIEQISGVNSQGDNLDEVRDNLKEALSIIADIKGIHDYEIYKEVIIDKSSSVHQTS
ncbi:type II toxin-antitoxin system HicB family antitoxin [Legionella bononiensis]|uniref:Type II toxin-antitoxin system HicB family antitoxin n=1 Tax=Legionella bononiensis TaxID=2793102 RepID=A0ABS1W8Q8_9GAMM|nr:type II toxin-antitoxin system HicB family antitoxin [Legionella bononiensis]MBL7479776.1 type II toxin-antitoxin system HicB family antitoxin [Legionella bononiensis]MBL7525710.1 type II toxin-antitoxin system HicB family antitoxin [Legionella bononiensis]MBL7561893.1 type II toxin-antitoxin system HicB family antitoxin [Legionella bononiensis]